MWKLWCSWKLLLYSSSANFCARRGLKFNPKTQGLARSKAHYNFSLVVWSSSEPLIHHQTVSGAPPCSLRRKLWTTLFWNQAGHGIRMEGVQRTAGESGGSLGPWTLCWVSEWTSGPLCLHWLLYKTNLLSWSWSHCEGFVVQSLSHVQLFAISWTAACQASLSFTISWSLLKLMFTESVMPSNYVILCRPLLLLPQSFPASGSFPVSWLFTSGGHSTGSSALALVLLMNFRVDFL